ncbi:MAG TPA: three-Cys-motif partner protein TcmP [Bacteroides mediterraneensis]|uniref:three-Cys-motif partner protein TcmP n=1 Tax=Bacteroides mediterraneensis TaxID=1841856 RepID=UPI0026ED688F|nr:three-Cys-motif partner protein TcmP [Bacteroides mediterraneensis]HJH64337.1 three-Cys-motif partner protein TcmP [Bacteroides mediterraneensis]
MKENHFFEQQTMSSRIKASIISEYFPKYCNIIINKHKPKELRYIDLFAGPGKYEDGNVSTPLLVARNCIKNNFLQQHVRFIFNDNTYKEQLEKNFFEEFPKGSFVINPFFGDRTVGEWGKITQYLIRNTHVGNYNESPALLFIDPFGYKGIETNVLAQFLQNWGNEIFIFINTKRIHPALENEKFESLMRDLFPTTYEIIKSNRKYKQSVGERLQLIIDYLGLEYQKILNSKVYYTAFRFQEEDIDTTSHYILHLTKGKRGFDLIKTIYNDFANVGTIFDGINTYTFDVKKINNPIAELFDVSKQNIEILKENIYSSYKGKTITAFELFEEHQITGNYCRSHYAKALRELVEENRIKSKFTDGKNHIVSVLISKNCIIEFK